ncbi:unnamed protein product [Symbiodinium sp. CCMP2592]|nr:unnamed protein product [Symbiodinium sp. CCMP2592]CAE7440335.1 unnamed protein product [Symbiodinium sp. CCMP2592]CAE7734644.1 unnamed protein product [Symbiodinium sp. CCMP2592]
MPKRRKKEPEAVTRLDERGVHVFKGPGQQVESFRDLRSAFHAGKPLPAEAAAEAGAGSSSSLTADAPAVEQVLAEDRPTLAEATEEAPARTPSANRKRPHTDTALDFLAPCTETLRTLVGAGSFSAADRQEAEELLAAASAIMSAELVDGKEKQDWPEILRLHTAATDLMARLQDKHQTAEATQRTPQSLIGSPWPATSPPSRLLSADLFASPQTLPPTPLPKQEKKRRTLSPDKE